MRMHYRITFCINENSPVLAIKKKNTSRRKGKTRGEYNKIFY